MRPTTTTTRKPEGGFVFITVSQLLTGWMSYKGDHIELRDLRCYLASFEMTARRCQMRESQHAGFTTQELAELTGLASAEEARRSVRRLEHAELIVWGRQQIKHPASHAGGSQRRVPVPRRILRHLCCCKRQAVLGVAIAYLIRALAYRDGQCVVGGRCKASTIARNFQLDLRTVKTARRHLIELGWLVPQATHQCQMNRHGMAVTLNMLWRSPCSPPASQPRHAVERVPSPPPEQASRMESPPPRPQNRIQPPPLTTLSKLPSGSDPEPEPRLTNIQPADLRQSKRLDKLYEQAVGKGWLGTAHYERLRFHAAAEHATLIGTDNPAGLFVATVRQQRWHYISQVSEDRARRRLAGVETR